MNGGRRQAKKPLEFPYRIGGMDNLNDKNKCIFEGANPNMVESLTLLGEEHHLWMLARAQALSHLMAPHPGS
jgi:hypothetical protein